MTVLTMGIQNQGVVFIVLAIIVVCVVVGAVYKFGFANKKDEQSETTGEIESIEERMSAECIGAPVEGELKELKESSDAVFADGIMGQGLLSIPSVGKVYAPADGTVSAFFPTGHALAITTDKGAEILIHVGMDTVKLEGKGFSPKVRQDDRVKKGDLLLEFDIDTIKAAGYSVETPIVVTNAADYVEVILAEAKSVKTGDTIITIR